LTISIMEALWATILFSGFALEVIIRRSKINRQGVSLAVRVLKTGITD